LLGTKGYVVVVVVVVTHYQFAIFLPRCNHQ
jgi:hypothetical protein